MRYSKGLVLYQDEPVYGLFLKVIMIVVPVSLLVTSISLAYSGESEGALALLVETFIISLIFLSVFPRRYQVFEDHLRIALGGPFSVKVGFSNIKTVRVTTKLNFGVNFATRMTGSYVEIALKRGLNINITPRDNASFAENANRAINEWLGQAQNKADIKSDGP
jgi:Mg2+/Co2+ transporter CorB